MLATKSIQAVSIFNNNSLLRRQQRRGSSKIERAIEAASFAFTRPHRHCVCKFAVRGTKGQVGSFRPLPNLAVPFEPNLR